MIKTLKSLTLAWALTLVGNLPGAQAQSSEFYNFLATGDQVVPGPGEDFPWSMNVGMQLDWSGGATTLRLIGSSFGVYDITQIAIHGPASTTNTGPLLLTIPFAQGVNSETALAQVSDLPISTATRDVIVSGMAYLEVRSISFPSGAVRGAISKEGIDFCFPRSDPNQPQGCGECPCGNGWLNANFSCMNSQGRAARLIKSGQAAVGADTLDFLVRGATSDSVALLLSGDLALPAASGACAPGTGVSNGFTDGLRCVGGQVLRHGVLPTDPIGDTVLGDFIPPGGFLAQNGFVAGQTRMFQVFYRDQANSPCGTGLNTTNGVQVSFVL